MVSGPITQFPMYNHRLSFLMDDRMIAFRLIAVLMLLITSHPLMADSGRLTADIRPILQSVHFKIDPSGPDYSGSTLITLRADREISEFSLHADGIEISGLRLGDDGEPVAVEYSIENDLLTVTSSRPLAPGRYGLAIDFSNEFNTQAVGLYRMESEGVGYAYTQFEASDARKAFPSFDEPEFKIPFQFTITAKESDEVVTNTPLHSETRHEGWKTLEFGLTRPLPTYLLALAVGPMESVPIPDLPVPGRIYTPKGMSGLTSYSGAMVAPILEWQQSYFGMAYPYQKLDFIAIPEYWPGAMEHPGAITFSDQIILLDENSVSANQRRIAALVIAHELAHQWFGNLVTLEWWDDLWLNESFADWFGDKTTTTLFPETRHELSGLRSVNGVMNTDARVTSEPIRQPVTNPAELLSNVGLAYSKGKSVIGMFERWIGQETFRKGVNAYLLDNAWGNASADQFWSALTVAAGSDVAASMETFLEQAGVPLVEASIEGDKIRIRQSRFKNHGAELPDQTWRIPVGLRFASEGRVMEKTVLLQDSEMDVEIDGISSFDWVMPNADGAGYYRWSIGDEAVQAIAPGAEKMLNDRERVSFLGNLGALLDSGLMGGGTYMQALGAFATDSEPLVVSAVITELDGVNDTFITPDLEEEFADYLRKALSPAVDRFGIQAKAGEDEAVAGFRPRLLYWLGRVAEDEAVMAWAKETTVRYMNQPSSVDPGLASVALRITAKQGGPELFDRYIEHFEAAQNPAERANFLRALGAFDDPALQQKALGYTLTGPLRPNEIFDIPGEIFDARVGGDVVYEWLTVNYEAVAGRMPPLFRPFLANFGGGCDRERLEKAKIFFARPEISVEGTEKQMMKTEAGVLDCVNLQQREAANVKAYLEGIQAMR